MNLTDVIKVMISVCAQRMQSYNRKFAVQAEYKRILPQDAIK